MNFNNKTYNFWLIFLLVGLNVFSLGALWWTNRPPQDEQTRDRHEIRERVGHYLKGELDLDESQLETFKELRGAHFKKVRTQMREIYQKRKEMLEAMTMGSADTVQATALATEIGRLNAEMEAELIMHFQELRAVCTPEQQEKLGKVFKKAAHRWDHPSKRKKKKPIFDHQ